MGCFWLLIVDYMSLSGKVKEKGYFPTFLSRVDCPVRKVVYGIVGKGFILSKA